MTDRRPLSILAVTNMYPTAEDPSYGVFVASQMRSIETAGHNVQVEFINGKEHASRYAAGIARVRRLARAGDFDLVHAHYGLTGFIASFQPLPLVVSFCGDDLNGTVATGGHTTVKSRVTVGLSQLAASRAEGLICKSEKLKGKLWRAFDRSRAHVVPNGVDTTLFHPADRLEARRSLGLDSTEHLVLFPHTRSEPVKRFDLAEAAVALLREQGYPVTLWVPDRVSHHQMPLQYQAADCLLLTSDREGSPNAVKEALCCDLPVVSVDAGDVSRWFAMTPGSELVNRSPAAIAAGLKSVIEAGKRVDGGPVRAAVGLAAIAEQLLSIYRDALVRPVNS